MLIVAALVLAVAQSPNDTAAIKAAAADSGDRAVVERVVADTAWVLVLPGNPDITLKRVRLERQAGKWVRTFMEIRGRVNPIQVAPFKPTR